MIVVETEGVEVAFSGGFTVSNLTDPVFGVRMNSSSEDVIVRDEDAEDDHRLGVGAFVHVYGKSWSRAVPAITFGLGIDDSSETTYFIGPFWRLGDKAFLGFGAAIGSVDRLPAGVREGDLASDANVLNNLGSKTEIELFYGIALSFLGDRTEDVFRKPFKPTDQN